MSKDFSEPKIPSLAQEWQALQTNQKLEAWSLYTTSQKAQLWQMFPHELSQPRSIRSLPGVGWKTLWAALSEQERRATWKTLNEVERGLLWDRYREQQQITNDRHPLQALQADIDSRNVQAEQKPQATPRVPKIQVIPPTQAGEVGPSTQRGNTLTTTARAPEHPQRSLPNGNTIQRPVQVPVSQTAQTNHLIPPNPLQPLQNRIRTLLTGQTVRGQQSGQPSQVIQPLQPHQPGQIYLQSRSGTIAHSAQFSPDPPVFSGGRGAPSQPQNQTRSIQPHNQAGFTQPQRQTTLPQNQAGFTQPQRQTTLPQSQTAHVRGQTQQQQAQQVQGIQAVQVHTKRTKKPVRGLIRRKGEKNPNNYGVYFGTKGNSSLVKNERPVYWDGTTNAPSLGGR